MFCAAAEAREADILKMYNVNGSLISIGPSLTANTPDTRYKLEVVVPASVSGSPSNLLIAGVFSVFLSSCICFVV